jgi:hypothetical protein
VFLSSITIKWDSISSNKGYVVEASTRSNFTGTIYSSNTADGGATTLTVPGLSINTKYYLRVGSLWNSGTTSYSSTIVSTATLAAQPGTPAAFSGFYLTVSWPSNGNPTWTEYFLWASTASDFTGTIYYPEPGANWFTGTSTVFYNLCPDTVYYFRAKARNLNNIETAVTELGSHTTEAPAIVDCGLRFHDGTGVITGACQKVYGDCETPNKLRIRKGDTTYGIMTVDQTDPKASKLKIQTPSGPKCFRKYP